MRKREQPFIANKRLLKCILHKKRINEDNKLQREYGFVANPNVSIFTNAILHYNKMTIYDYMSKIANLKFHNLFDEGTYLPQGIGNVLGKGLKFCVQPREISKEQVTEERERFKRDVRLKYFFQTI